uniref:Octanoyl-[acyl-carrier-protein]:protein N-octanoyltransferase LIPT2, mitochondrial n=3 Tax=Macrostomum lignano TaxID=282301 RepID=A0A1I8HNY5_9PLAT
LQSAAAGPSPRRLIRAIWHGRLSYKEGLLLQRFHSALLRSRPLKADCLLLLEHRPVYTVGIRGVDPANSADGDTDQLAARLRSIGAEFHRADRGGLLTFHGPGQLVAYPMLDLRNHGRSLRDYVCRLQRTVVDLCARGYGLGDARTTEDVGVWIADRKVAALGVHAANYLTSHGVAINCNVDLAWFQHIVPCGLLGKSVTSLTNELGRDVSVESVLPEFLDSFSAEFNCEVQLTRAATADFCVE